MNQCPFCKPKPVYFVMAVEVPVFRMPCAYCNDTGELTDEQVKLYSDYNRMRNTGVHQGLFHGEDASSVPRVPRACRNSCHLGSP